MAFDIHEGWVSILDFMRKMHVTDVRYMRHFICEMIILTNLTEMKHSQIKDGLQFFNRTRLGCRRSQISEMAVARPGLKPWKPCSAS